MLVNGLEVRALGLDGSPLRHFILDATRDSQQQP